MFFLKKKKDKESRNQKQGRRPSPEPAASSERFVTVIVGRGQFACAYVLPAAHLTSPRLAPLVAMAEDDQQGGGDVVRIPCYHSDFVDAMVWTALEEAKQGRTACGQVVAPSCAAAGTRRQASPWMWAKAHRLP